MGNLLLPCTLLGLIVILVFHCSRLLRRSDGDEESAHALALERRQKSAPERRRQHRYSSDRSANASILGRDDAALDCRILDISRSGMRIVIPEPMPMGAQVNVAWENQFFVGTVRYSTAQHGKHVVGLRMISTNRSDT